MEIEKNKLSCKYEQANILVEKIKITDEKLEAAKRAKYSTPPRTDRTPRKPRYHRVITKAPSRENSEPV